MELIKKLLLSIVILASIGCVESKYVDKNLHYELKQLTLNTEKHMSGTFFLFIGSFYENTEKKAYFYTKNIYEVIRYRETDLNDIRIYEDLKDGEKPYATHKASCHIETDNCTLDYMGLWHVHIPENTIFQKYNFDLKQLK